MLEVVVECVAGDVGGECSEGLFRGVALDVRAGAFDGVPNLLGWIVVGCVWRQVDQLQTRQSVAGFERKGSDRERSAGAVGYRRSRARN